MDPSVKRLYQVLIFGGIGVLLVIMAVATPGILDDTDFSMYNSGWNGCSSLAVKTYKTGKLQPTFSFEATELTLTPRSFVEYSVVPSNTTILIVGPRTVFTAEEARYLRDFVWNGGLLLLADDFGTGNDVLQKMNASTRFLGGLLVDLSFEKKAEFVTVFDFVADSHPLAKNESVVVLNYATALQVQGMNTSVIARSSAVSWIDKNENSREDAGEPRGPFPVLVSERFGDGEILVLSDPSLLINSMKNQLMNAEFCTELLRYLYTGRSTVIIDESHRVVSTPLHVFYTFPISISVEVKMAIVLLGVGIFFVGFTPLPRYLIRIIVGFFTRSRKNPETVSIETMVDDVLNRHPSWSRRKLEDFISRLKP